MYTKSILVLIYIRNKCEVGTVKQALRRKKILTAPRCCFFCGSFLLFVFCVCHNVLSVTCIPVVSCWEKTHLLALLYVIFSCFCHFLIWCPRSDAVFYCMDSWFLYSFYFYTKYLALYFRLC